MDRAERIAVSVAATLVLAAATVAAGQRLASPRVERPAVEEPSEPKRSPPARALPVGPDLYPVGETTVEEPSGVAITDVVRGLGPPARPGDVAVVELSVWSPDGHLADSTFRRPGPTRVVVPSDRAGSLWELALDWMRVGGERRVEVPRGVDPSGQSVLQVELLDLLPPPLPPDPTGPFTDVDGLGVRDLRVGGGPELTDGRVAVVDYTVWLPHPDTDERGAPQPLDSSLRRPEPFTVALGRDPVAWAPALAGARAGGRRLIRVPPALAFGDDGRPPLVPPRSELLVDVEVRAVE